MKIKLESQSKLDNEFPKLDVSPLVEELRRRATIMPKISIDMSWISRSACQGVDSAIFFPDGGAGVKVAKTYCAGCPVRNECLEYALLNNIDQGVWGGASERQRARLVQERRRLVAEKAA